MCCNALFALAPRLCAISVSIEVRFDITKSCLNYERSASVQAVTLGLKSNARVFHWSYLILLSLEKLLKTCHIAARERDYGASSRRSSRRASRQYYD